MVVNFGLVSEGWDNLKKISSGGWDAVKDVFTPKKKDVVQQVKEIGGGGPAPAIVKVAPEVVPTVLDPIVNTVKDASVWKYAKYVAIGGAALLAYSVLKK